MRRAEGDSRTVVNDTLQTINAAATAIAEAENRVTQATIQKRRWRNFWSLYWCFGAHKHTKRIGHAVIVQETTTPGVISAANSENLIQTPTFSLPFIAPPSSPASFLQSEPPSVTQSPAGSVSNIYMSANMYSPSGPASIFAIGPYAYETQLVSPPVFSAFPTEPSTAPFTPPPESVHHLTTPSSPEVPFAQQLDPHFRNGEDGQRFPIFHYEFQSYHLHPGSPVGPLISPRSAISGSGPSSPFPDGEFASGSLNFPDFRMGDPPKLDNLDKISYGKWGLHQTPDSVKSTPQSINLGCHDDEHDDEQTIGVDRVSFDLPSEAGLISRLNGPTTQIQVQEKLNEVVENNNKCCLGETSATKPEKAEETNQHQNQGSTILGSNKEFHFDNVEGNGSSKPINGSDWWANEKVVGKEAEESSSWSFFPVIQTGVR